MSTASFAESMTLITEILFRYEKNFSKTRKICLSSAFQAISCCAINTSTNSQPSLSFAYFKGAIKFWQTSSLWQHIAMLETLLYVAHSRLKERYCLKRGLANPMGLMARRKSPLTPISTKVVPKFMGTQLISG